MAWGAGLEGGWGFDNWALTGAFFFSPFLSTSSLRAATSAISDMMISTINSTWAIESVIIPYSSSYLLSKSCRCSWTIAITLSILVMTSLAKSLTWWMLELRPKTLSVRSFIEVELVSYIFFTVSDCSSSSWSRCHLFSSKIC